MSSSFRHFDNDALRVISRDRSEPRRDDVGDGEPERGGLTLPGVRAPSMPAAGREGKRRR